MKSWPVRYYAAVWGELPIYGGTSRALLLWVPNSRSWIPSVGSSKTNRHNFVFRTALNKPTRFRRLVQDAARALPAGAAARGKLLVWLGYGSFEDCLHWGLAYDGRVRTDPQTNVAILFEPKPPAKLTDWPVPAGTFPTELRCT